jgi:MFS family permease
VKPITAVLLNVAHAIDHMFLLIFATAVGTIALEFGFARWEDLMPYSVGAFFMFGVGSVPSGRFGDLWGRKRMMEVFFYGMGLAALLVALTQNAWQMAAALVVVGLFGSIYHPVGIPMLVQRSAKPGQTIGINGLVGNLGIAVAALLTGFIVKYFGWRMAFVVPGIFSIVCGLIFSATTPAETEAPAKRTGKAKVQLPPAVLARVFLVMTLAAITSSLLFNFSTNGNAQLMRERFVGIVDDPARLGVLLAIVYAVASIAQVIVGRLIDRYPLKRIYVVIIMMQIPLFLLAAYASGWTLFVLLIAFMAVIFGAIPFTDAMIVRYVDDSMRSRVSGMRLAVSFGISSLAVWLLGPFVKVAGFQVLLLTMAAIAFCTFLIALLLPSEQSTQAVTGEAVKT